MIVKKDSQVEHIRIDVIIPMYNSSTTILHTLESLVKQKYPIGKIIVVDNASTDICVTLVQQFKNKSPYEILIIPNKKNMGVGYSYNAGVAKSSTPYIVFMHSDTSLPTENELGKLVAPFKNSGKVVATYPTAVVPSEVWNGYNFWQKCRFARSVGIEIGFNAKFDCLKKDVFLQCGGFDENNFAKDTAIGGEDADLYIRLEKYGEIVLSKAKVVHLHYLGKSYFLSDWIKNRKMLARTYGRLVRFDGASLPLATSGFAQKIPLGSLLFFVKPVLALFPLLPNLHVIGLMCLLIYTFFSSKRMYTTRSTLLNPRIVFLPFVDIFLIYYEAFWMFQTLVFSKKKSIMSV